MLVKMKTGLSGPELSLSPGDEHEFDDAEAQRLIDAGFAEPSDTSAAGKPKKLAAGAA
jgi:hypothetical protein